MNSPTLTADAEGVWFDDGPNRRLGIAWGDICRISGYKLDAKVRVLIVVALDRDNGEFFELMDDWSGFEDVTRIISDHVPEIDSAWIDRIRSLDVEHPGVVVWQRA
ncbi:MAG: hypothetical protein K2X38_21020 [Gemmataceae bacterium]|nr:hypothetical protein [Gemmataceae bacterium]